MLKLNDIISTTNNIIDFNNRWIYIDAGSNNTYTGFIKPDGYTIKNLNVYIKGNIGPNGGGIICPNSRNFTIENCNVIVNGNIGEGAGGIVGSNAGFNDTKQNTKCYIINCYSSGIISGTGAGGIVGSYAANNGGKCYIANCYSDGKINGTGAGGIVGSNAANCNISNCYSSGNITKNVNNTVGDTGIIGSNATKCNISNCYSNGHTKIIPPGNKEGIDNRIIILYKIQTDKFKTIQDESINSTSISGIDKNIKKMMDDGWKNFIIYDKISDYPVLKTRLKTAGFSATYLKTAGFSATDLKTAGFSATDLKEAEFSAEELKAAGFSITSCTIS
jgi:hypothetical protein